ncbi:hypothetical protein BDA99DRAFT_601564 [Phascolomyces articulosus]|uniref:Uncharacterized protein n=1 Tax=Phascolomyces articulosus TaxID=60185 RepID=A0AAD5PIE2_9FUNG|nr:hypothetical protein BDA99DRAFT_601564 [Phascolomyces articulosus]
MMNFDYLAAQSILLKIPGGVFAAILAIIPTIIAERIQQNNYTGASMCIISFVGVLILAVIKEGAVKLLGYYLSWAMSGAGALLAATIGANVSGYTKKIFYNSCMVAATTLGSFIGPLIMLEREAPRYITGGIVYCVGNGVAIICFLLDRAIMVRKNKLRLANPPDHRPDLSDAPTDVEDKGFIYKL